MNEQELRKALHDAVVASSPPPPMDPRTALGAARRADRRRKTTWGAGVAGLAVVGIAVGATLLPSHAGGGSAEVGASQPGTPTVTATTTVPPTTVTTTVMPTTTGTAAPTSRGSAPSWPDGQTDRTATSGPRAAKGSGLVDALAGALPVGSITQERGGAAPRTQAQFVDYAGDLQVWEYLIEAPVSPSGAAAGVARVLVQVETRGNSRVRDLPGCGPAIDEPYPVRGDGRCDVVRVGGADVPVVTALDAGPTDYEQAAFHRHADGTLVVVAQSRRHPVARGPALTEPLLTPQQLAGIAVDPAFHLD
ncbi:hypothetical protein [Saccharothrix yanglingensis]|uniref:Uncharacterized protein n=1 Tax=Saccharothrix yanglingensis TaxID=659496 RepID=A0ABU0XC05_9PSEU|nr:hypothetical protein [Saccharothrix yanglingensis]MDQ2588214.1 hypothetical protein [Saccharothrix yanglingensis]